MTDFKSRIHTYFERTRRGVDTHRDDIGTLQERKNKILIRAGQRGGTEYSNKEYARTFLIKREILMTLLEDGVMPLIDFDSRFQALIAQHHMDDQQQLSRQFNNSMAGSMKAFRSRQQLIERLTNIRIKRLEERLENE